MAAPFAFLGMEDVTLDPKSDLHHSNEAPPPSYQAWRAKYEGITASEQYERRHVPQHTDTGEADERWLAFRFGCASGSTFSTPAGVPYSVVKKLAKPYSFEAIEALVTAPVARPQLLCRSILSNTFSGNVATRYGNEWEPECQKQFLEWFYYHEYYLKVGTTEVDAVAWRIENPGFCVPQENSWCGMSPDGILEVTHACGQVTRNLCEWKCPYGKRNNASPKGLYGPMETRTGDLFPIEPYYYVQCIYGMGILYEQGLLRPKDDDVKNLKVYFGVWIPAGIEVSVIPFDPVFYEQLMAKVKPFWRTHYLPALYRHTYPLPPQQHAWTGRTVECMNGLLGAAKEYIRKKTKAAVAVVVDWGAGTGAALRQCHAFFPTAALVGFELHVPPPTDALPGVRYHTDILRVAPTDLPAGDVQLHYVYDGGVYGRDLSAHIAALVSSVPSHCCVVVVTSLAPPNRVGEQFTVSDWNAHLKGFSRTRAGVDVFENNDQTEETMRATIFWK